MKHIEINLGKACNNKCLFCMSGNLDYFVDFEKIKREIIQNAKNGYESLGFLGGEVTIHPNLNNLIKLAKQNGFKKIHIVSNGRKYKDIKLIKELINLGVNRFSVSIHSHLSEVEDYLTQVKGGFNEKIHGLKNLIYLKEKGFFEYNISINFVINKKNYKDILKSLLYFNKLGLNDFRLNFMWPEGNAINYFQELLISYTDFVPYINKILSISKKLKFHVVFEGIPFCVIPKIENNVRYIGELVDVNTDVVTCEGKKIYRFNWQNRKKDCLKSKRLECQKCKFFYLCEGVWNKYIEFFDWQEFRPILN